MYVYIPNKYIYKYSYSYSIYVYSNTIILILFFIDKMKKLSFCEIDCDYVCTI